MSPACSSPPSAPRQGPALGSAIHAAVAAGKYPDIRAAAAAMGSEPGAVYTPIPENVAAYEELFREYRTLHDYFGRGTNDVMHRLKAIQRDAVLPLAATTLLTARGVRMSALLESIARIRARGLRPARRTHALRAGGLDRRQRLRPRPRL